ncbi:hypothetical protein [Poseidonia sp.]|uniref:hypothetical protein n=1 Tax=Poseidonia sp. TaxID=2666344 RepID=UPI003F6A0DE3
MTGCLDIADTAEAEESEEETTIVNNYYNNTTTIVQSVEPQMVHMYAHSENNSVGTITINENQTIEWLESESLIDTGSQFGAQLTADAIQITGVSCIDTDVPYFGNAGSGFAIKGEGECTYTLSINYGNNLIDGHHSLVYLIHEL